MTILLTGASGFIGARLAECLTGAYGMQIHALVHRIGTIGTARLARLRVVRLFGGDVRDSRSVEQAAAGCSQAIHCATATSGTGALQRDTELLGVRHVLDAARRHGLARVVYLSSAMVHDVAGGRAPSGARHFLAGEDIAGSVAGRITEDAPLDGRSAYARAKIAAEQRVRQSGLPAVILRPTAVWGPWSPTWTVAAVQLIQRGIAFLPRQGQGAANTVYIDNVADAVWLALTKPEAIGQVFLINDDQPRTWGEFYGAYARQLGMPLRCVASHGGALRMTQVSAQNLGVAVRRLMTGRVRGMSGLLHEVYDHIPVVKFLINCVPGDLVQPLKQRVVESERRSAPAMPAPGASEYREYPWIARWTRQLYGSSARYSNERLKSLLGWRSRVLFDEAMSRTGEWLDYAGISCRAAAS